MEVFDKFGELCLVLGVVMEVVAMKQGQFTGKVFLDVTQTKDGHYYLVEFKRPAPLLADIVGEGSPGAGHEDKPVACPYGVGDFLVEGKLPARHVYPIEPDIKTRLLQVIIKPTDKRLVIPACV
ncbi:MAG: hypothetical protein NUV74_12960 [Candidatus Brocadiaceae bacterium]|nr:hypothetical protein [Candidatus Brocadiaceae bacterium]